MAAIAEQSHQDQLSPGSMERLSGGDLKSRLLEQLNAERKPGQILKVTQVGKTGFRVNWMSPVDIKGDASVLRTYKMSCSRFLRVEDADGVLKITDLTR